MHFARLPTRRVSRHLPEDIVSGRALAARRQTKDFDVRRQCAHMKYPKRRLRSAGRFVAKMAELIINGQPYSGQVRRLLKDQEITEQICVITDRTTRLIAPDPQKRVYDPLVNPHLAKACWQVVQVM